MEKPGKGAKTFDSLVKEAGRAGPLLYRAKNYSWKYQALNSHNPKNDKYPLERDYERRSRVQKIGYGP